MTTSSVYVPGQATTVPRAVAGHGGADRGELGGGHDVPAPSAVPDGDA